jgi:hypothetical protein
MPERELDAAIAPGPDLASRAAQERMSMKSLMVLIAWCFLFVLCWPIALVALVLWPVVWLITLPFRLVGIAVGAVFALLAALLFLPARLLGARPGPATR